MYIYNDEPLKYRIIILRDSRFQQDKESMYKMLEFSKSLKAEITNNKEMFQVTDLDVHAGKSKTVDHHRDVYVVTFPDEKHALMFDLKYSQEIIVMY